ncbi:Gfo/Idh/MocA family oxidoreductase [Pontibacter sp. G13]|uniref:Gfo/Idh/MocA family protein n=1 Tax=Pontibacter sp. G13 TaxID=3074898 RepID=UPI00288BD189|nr:Gfo/Idh/MocA family oxidoreductase [Pontibacter sp. G13]WNJ19988.1 Gfo/Idh/MocA family oxidoreductase [Pontibacter sp. G13]
MQKNESGRRGFLRKLGISAVGIASTGKALASERPTSFQLMKRTRPQAPQDTIRIGLIGAGIMGRENTKTALKHEGIELVAVCDLYEGRRSEAQEMWGDHLFLTDDHTELLKRKDVDAVIIATPDHWHKQISIDALQAGKHVYCEKPMVHSVAEGQELIDAWKKSGMIFQVGSQGMSSLGNEMARQLLADGAIGTLNYAEGFWARHSPWGAWQYNIPEDASTDTVNWDRFVSNTQDRPFDAMRFFRWRNYTDYGTGMSGDLFVHLFSSLHFITQSKGPNQICAMGGLRYWQDGREVPDVMLGTFQYPETDQHPGFNLSLRCNFVDGTSGSTYLKLVGSKGSMDVKWEEVVLKRNQAFHSNDPFMEAQKAESDASNPDRKRMLPPEEIVYRAEKGYLGAHYDHFGNFFHAIRTGGSVEEDPVFGFRAAAPALLCNDSYHQNTFINWDPDKMAIVPREK